MLLSQAICKISFEQIISIAGSTSISYNAILKMTLYIIFIISQRTDKMTHVFIVNDITLKYHFEYMFAGIGANCDAPFFEEC